MEDERLTCVLIGSDSLLIECGELWRSRGHLITAVVTDAPRISRWARQHGIEVVVADKAYGQRLEALSFDYLFAITFLRVIPKEVLRLPKRAAINFHDGPLPSYAGLNAPAWALINGETEYGVTWHVMSEQLDGGEILKQVHFELNPDDTSLSLNTRCFSVAIESFGALVDELAQGREQRTQQAPPADASKAYFGRYTRPAAAALLDLREPAERCAALVRALDFGPRYPNLLGAPMIVSGTRALVVTAAEASPTDGAAAPGTLVASGSDSLSVACGSGTLVIRGLTWPCGAPVAMSGALSALNLEVGAQLTLLGDAERSALSELDARLARAERHWMKQLAALEPTEAPYVRGADAASARYAEQSVQVEVPAEFRAAFGDEAAIAAAFAAYVGRLAGSEQVTLALSDPQLHEAARGLSALVATQVPLTLQVEPASSFSQVVQRFEAERAQMRERGSYLRNIGARYPELTGSAALARAGLTPIGVALGVDARAGTDLQLHVDNAGARLRFASERLSASDATRIAHELQAFMRALAAHRDTPVQDIALLDDSTRERVLLSWNRTQQPLPDAACIHRQIEAQVDRTPDAVAVACEERSLTFKQLDEASNRVAHRLLALGVGFDKPVGVHVERSIELVVAALGIMKAGAAYVPLDPTYPPDRVALMIEDAHLDVIVTQTSLAAGVAKPGVRTLVLDERQPAPDTKAEAAATGETANAADNVPATRPAVAVQPNHLAYLIYTSGSTGKPKGVMIEHRQAVNFLLGMDQRVAHGSDAGNAWLAVTSLSFDISVLELWWTLARGFKVVVHADRARAGATSSKRADSAARSRPIDFSLFYFSADAQATGSARYKLLLEGAKFADERGFAAVWTPERHFHAFGGLYPNPAVTGAAIAAITKRVGIRAGSVVLPLHHPVRVAEQWAVVDNLSNGRVGVSVAAGWQPDDFILRPESYKEAKKVMMRDLEVVRRLWRGETVEFPGPLGPVRVRTMPDPVQKELPVWVTTAGTAETFELAGAAGANLLTHLLGQTLDQLKPKIEAYRAARAKAGLDPNTGIVSLMLHTFVGEDRERVKDMVRGPLKAYLATSMDLIKDKAWTFPAFRRPKGFKADEPGSDLASLSDEDRDALLDAAFERYFEQSGLFGTVDDALQMVDKVKTVGVDDVACLIDFGAPSDIVLEHLPFIDQVRTRELELRQPLSAASASSEAAEAANDTSAVHPFLRDVRAHSVTHMQCTPSMARMFVGNEECCLGLSQLKHIFLGGEALPADLLRELRKHTSATITNMYGPTETTVWSSTYRVEQSDLDDPQPAGVPIGTPIANTSLYVVDAKRRPLPPDVIGELWIGGAGVARGYWERPELTAERFVSDPFCGEAGARMYCTGDRARWRSDGIMEFFGRADHQVKLRGYRIELGEIEARARALAGVEDSVVIVREDRPGDQRLVGYLVPSPGSKLDLDAVREQLRAQLPEFMVPAAFVVLEELPLTPNRKIDRKALPEPTLQADSGQSAATEAPESDTDKAIAEVWQEVLGRDRVGIDDNFFDLGGHSLLVVRAHRQLQDALGRALALTDLYRFPTIRKLSTFLSQGSEQESGATKQAGARGAKRREAMRRRSG